MQDFNKYNEIDELGENEDYDVFDDDHEYYSQEKKTGTVPFAQMIVCVMILLGLLFLKYFDDENYVFVTDWYKESINQEIELPKLKEESDAPPASTDQQAVENSAQVSAESEMVSDSTAAQAV